LGIWGYTDLNSYVVQDLEGNGSDVELALAMGRNHRWRIGQKLKGVKLVLVEMVIIVACGIRK